VEGKFFLRQFPLAFKGSVGEKFNTQDQSGTVYYFAHFIKKLNSASSKSMRNEQEIKIS
jgi:hypothetical protein